MPALQERGLQYEIKWFLDSLKGRRCRPLSRRKSRAIRCGSWMLKTVGQERQDRAAGTVTLVPYRPDRANKNELFLTRGEWVVMEKPLCPLCLCVRLD